MVLGGLCVIAACVLARYYWGTTPATAEVTAQQSARSPTTPAAGTTAPAAEAGGPGSLVPARKPVPEIVAMVNGLPVTREELARECRIHYGKEVLESMVNKYLILQECRRRGISVSRKEVDTEIEQMAKSFNLPVEQWLKLLQQERGVKPEQYAADIIWPSLALRKLAGDRLAVTPEELMAAFESEYGAMVTARLIVCSTQEKAQKVQALAAANPADFGNLAKTYSEDMASASVKGLIQPIRKHGPCREIEQAAFSLGDGEVSRVILTSGQYVILKREKLLAPRPITLEQAQPRLEKIIRDRKLHAVAGEVFQELQKRARVQNVYNDPLLSQRLEPGIVALINDLPIGLRQLDEECIVRHGGEVLEDTIRRKLIEAACKRQNVAVSPAEVDAEIARTAAMMVRPLPDKSPDVKAWLDLVTKKQGISVELYRRDVVWPAVALQKLAGAGGKVTVSEDDLRKGFAANYGPRVRCRAIVMSSQRRAQQVWEMARKNLTLENFGELAAKYSIESGSRVLKGEVPPIRKYGGQPLLEEEAFALKPGDISGVIQVDDKYIILFCEGYTKPVEVEPAAVRDLIYADIREKKQRLAMADYFEHLQEAAVVNNFLEPESSHSPAQNNARREDNRVTPTLYEAQPGK
jgi:parvulin-like peptidyl-prolyl isomerase